MAYCECADEDKKPKRVYKVALDEDAPAGAGSSDDDDRDKGKGDDGLAGVDLSMPLRADEVMPVRSHRVVGAGDDKPSKHKKKNDKKKKDSKKGDDKDKKTEKKVRMPVVTSSIAACRAVASLSRIVVGIGPRWMCD